MTCRKIGRSLLSLRRLSRAVVTAPEVRPPDLSGRAVANLVKGLFPFKKVDNLLLSSYSYPNHVIRLQFCSY